ncbi:hypothetical protein DVK02_06940 [Halobellus sp. Atlit-31R]|nr:hypothetical protein DVK02_06940 [Halobellus sp. Atlit-31R]
MSSVPRSLDATIPRDSLRRGTDAITAVARAGRRSTETVSFWAAIVLPVTYLPLVVGGLTGGESILFVWLVALNALAFVFGHGHEPGTHTDRS